MDPQENPEQPVRAESAAGACGLSRAVALVILCDVDKAQLLCHLANLDQALQKSALLFVYGSAACILLDEPDRASLDVDVAAPYSQADFADLQQAGAKAGLPVNPAEDYQGDHIEWISALRLCLPKPSADRDILLWQGSRLVIKTTGIPELIASKLIRYDETDQADIQYLCAQQRVEFAAVEAAVEALPPPFNRDALVRENLQNLKSDMTIWRTG